MKKVIFIMGLSIILCLASCTIGEKKSEIETKIEEKQEELLEVYQKIIPNGEIAEGFYYDSMEELSYDELEEFFNVIFNDSDKIIGVAYAVIKKSNEEVMFDPFIFEFENEQEAIKGAKTLNGLMQFINDSYYAIGNVVYQDNYLTYLYNNDYVLKEDCILNRNMDKYLVYFGNSETVHIPSGVIEIKDNAFYNRDNVKTIYFNEELKCIGHNLFYPTNSLEQIYFGSQLERIKSRAFLYCYNLKNFTLPSSVKYINEAAFGLCTSLTEVIIPNSIYKIGEAAFERCTNLEKVTVYLQPSTRLGKALFYNTQNVELTLVGYDQLNELINSETFIINQLGEKCKVNYVKYE